MIHDPKPHLRVPPAAGAAREPAKPRGLPLVVRAVWQRLKRANAWLEDSWVGDLIGVICLFAIGYGLTVFAWVLS